MTENKKAYMKVYREKNKEKLKEYSKYLGIWFNGCEIHHIDGDVLNNTETNLIALTPEKHRYAHFLLKESKKQYYNWIEQQKVG